MAIHVSIHDVSPAWGPEVDQALRLCTRYGIRPGLLVVPNFHGSAPLAADEGFCERLRSLQREGHEVFLHGFFHRTVARVSPGLRWSFSQKIVSQMEAEFADLSPREAAKRLDDGRDALERVGLRVDGFVPPAWSMHRWLLPLLAERGFRFTEDHLHVYDPQARHSRASLVLNYASRSPSRLLSTVAFCRAARPAHTLLPTRIAIHPADFRAALLRSELERLIAWAAPRSVSSVRQLLS